MADDLWGFPKHPAVVEAAPDPRMAQKGLESCLPAPTCLLCNVSHFSSLGSGYLFVTCLFIHPSNKPFDYLPSPGTVG